MKSSNQHPFYYQAGFSLVEIMVGLVIGLLATLVIMQVFSVFEGQKRTTTGTSDAQTNGSIALYTIGRELQSAGFALQPTADSPLECTALAIDAATGVGSLFPVTITDGGALAGASDGITIRYGSTNTGGIATPITSTIVGMDAPVNNNQGCQVNDIAIIINGVTSCNLTKVTGPTDIAIPPVPSIPPNTTRITLQNTTGAVPLANIACLGTWNEITYRVNNNALERNGVPSVMDIVNIQAQYGISAAANSNKVTQWVDASGATWAAPTVVNRNRIKAVRIAVVARNGLLEKENVTSTCTTNKGTVNNGPCAWDDTDFDPAPIIDLSKNSDGSNNPDWQRYRYRVYESVIPLRNMIWSQSIL